jgi:hypothetical protein
VLHACKRVSERMKNDQQAVDVIGQLSQLVSRARDDRDY